MARTSVEEFALPKSKIKAEEGETDCLGWCNKKFWSKDKVNLRYCNRCASKKEQIEREMSRTQIRGEKVRNNLNFEGM